MDSELRTSAHEEILLNGWGSKCDLTHTARVYLLRSLMTPPRLILPLEVHFEVSGELELGLWLGLVTGSYLVAI